MVVQVPCLHQTRCLLLVCTYLLSTQLHVKELRELDKYRKLLEDQKNIYPLDLPPVEEGATITILLLLAVLVLLVL